MISFESVTKRFADGTTAVDNVDLEVPEGDLTVLVGPSGCGKTTTLRMINRMIEATSGRIVVDGRDVAQVDPPELRRRIGYVIQQIGLFPHRTIGENIGTVPELIGWDKKRTQARVNELLELVGLPAEVRDRYPHQLSGGQRQRVGVARALAVDPPIPTTSRRFRSCCAGRRTASGHAWTSCSSSSASTRSRPARGTRRSCRADSASASAWRVRSRWILR